MGTTYVLYMYTKDFDNIILNHLIVMFEITSVLINTPTMWPKNQFVFKLYHLLRVAIPIISEIISTFYT